MEKELAERLGFPMGKTQDRSRIVSHWIKQGLKYFTLAGKRLFIEQDVVSWLNKQKG